MTARLGACASGPRTGGHFWPLKTPPYTPPIPPPKEKGNAMRMNANQKRAAALTASKIEAAKNDPEFQHWARKQNAQHAASKALTPSGAINAYLMAR